MRDKLAIHVRIEEHDKNTRNGLTYPIRKHAMFVEKRPKTVLSHYFIRRKNSTNHSSNQTIDVLKKLGLNG